MKIAFRADASITIGSGHVMRCLTLADTLRAQGDEILFLCRDFPGNLNAQIEQRGHALHRLPADDAAQAGEAADPTHAGWLGASSQSDAAECAVALEAWGNADWLVVDHYAIDRRWESLLRRHCRRMMVIDDLADRPHDCDVLLDQNLQSSPERYRNLLAADCRRLLGPRFALLRPEFRELRESTPPRDGTLKRVLVFLGGGDPGNATATALQGILGSGLGPHIRLDVVIGAAHPHRQAIEAICHDLPGTQLHVQTPYIAALMAAADLMIGAAGTTTWERCCLGLPSLLVSLADNQRENGRQIARRRAALYLGEVATLSAERLGDLVRRLNGRPALLRHLARRAHAITSGDGADLVALSLHADQLQLRAAGPSDCERIWRWRNDPRTRRTAFDPRPIKLAAHRQWYRGVLNNPRQILLLAAIRDRGIGVLRYDLNGPRAEISVYLDPDLHGLGFGSRLIGAGNRWISERRLPVDDLIARVRAENAASLKAFGEAGFRAEGDDRLTLHWHPEP